MSTLEDLVPPVELCKKIPEGKFKNSALIWFFDGKNWWVNAREFDAQAEKQYPAPTLAEILREMAANHPNYIREITVEADTSIEFNVVAYTRDDYDNEYQYDANAATAALKLWLGKTEETDENRGTEN